MKLKLGIIIPAWGEKHSLAETLILNWALFSKHAEELIICSDTVSTPEIIKLVSTIKFLQPSPLQTVRVLNGGSDMSKTVLLNQGFLASQSPNLLYSDADIVWTEQALRDFKSVMADGRIAHARKIMRWGGGIENEETDPIHERSRLAEVREIVQFTSVDGRTVSVQKSALYPRDSARSGPGILGISRAQFEAIDGYNGELTSYGWEDIDILIRAGLLLNVASETVGNLYEMPAARRSTELAGRLASEALNYQKCLVNYCLGLLCGSLSHTPPAIIQSISNVVSGMD